MTTDHTSDDAMRLNMPDALPECLELLTDRQREIVDDSLSNDENTSDDEMTRYWIAQAGLTEQQAQAAIAYRNEALRDPFFQLFPTSGGAAPGR